MTLRRAATIFEMLVLAAVVVTVVLLFTNQPTAPTPLPEEVVDAAGGIDGAALYGSSCAGCHGGDGSGGIGPRLGGGRVVERFPDPAGQIAVVTNGRGGMPAFGSKYGPEEIAAIVDYTRTALGTG